MKYWKNIYKDKPELKSIKSIKGPERMPTVTYEPMFYDSETSNIKHKEKRYITKKKYEIVDVVDETWVYLWMCSVGDFVYYGRYLHEFFELLEFVHTFYHTDELNKIDIWIHNASYDISYMYDLLFKFNGGTSGINMLFIKERQLICWEFEELGITIKCTYRLTNRSLDKWCRDLHIKDAKLTGVKDYSAIYYPWDKLPKNEYKYGAYDIISLKECFYKEIEMQGYNFANCPMTQTGFVRKDFQKAYNDPKKYKSNHETFKKTRVNLEQYNRLTRAAMGGYVASSITTMGQKIEWKDGIGHCDFRSHYPTNMRIRQFPQKPITVKEEGDKKQIKFKMLSDYIKMGYLFVVDIALKDIQIREGVTMPFLSVSKCVATKGTIINEANGKVLGVKGEIRVCCTNLDLKIYTEQYVIKEAYVYALDVYTTRKLPDYILNTVDKYYAKKAELKEDPEHETDEDKAVTYNISKQKVNGVFGCTYQRIIRSEIVLDSEDFTFSGESNEKMLDEFYDEKHERTSCVAFQWGVFVTAWARFELYTVVSKIIGYDNVLYCDTDSAFFLYNEEIQKKIEEYNKECYNDSVANNYYVTMPNGRREYYHAFDFEKDHRKSKTFKALHAKCYALEPDGKLKCTIAGVSAKSKDKTLTREQELGSIDELKVGKEFVECGGTRVDYSTVKEYEGYTGGGAVILDNVKTIGDTRNDYLKTKYSMIESEV